MSYYRYSNASYYRPSFFGGFQFFPPVIKALLIANVTAWLLLDLLLRPIMIGGVPVFRLIEEYLMLWPISMLPAPVWTIPPAMPLTMTFPPAVLGNVRPAPEP